jgi:hypothetical protein
MVDGLQAAFLAFMNEYAAIFGTGEARFPMGVEPPLAEA